MPDSFATIADIVVFPVPGEPVSTIILPCFITALQISIYAIQYIRKPPTLKEGKNSRNTYFSPLERQSERLQHDMKNHIIALWAPFQNSEWEKMDDCLKNMARIQAKIVKKYFLLEVKTVWI